MLHPTALATPAPATRSAQAWAQARTLLGGAVVGAAALAAAPAQALTEIAPEPTLQYGSSVSGNHNSSGWFTSDPHSGSADGQVFGTLSEGVKLYGESTLAREAYKYNTANGDSTGLAMAWWGEAVGLRANQFDPETGELTQAGDHLALHYEFSLTGPESTTWHLRAGFTDQLYLDNNAGLLQANLFLAADAYGALSSDGARSFAGEISTDSVDWLPDSGPMFWVITLSADLPYNPSQGLHLFVPQQSIDAGVNLVPTLLPVPEPATWALWLTGMAALGGLARRRQRGADVADVAEAADAAAPTRGSRAQ